MSEPPPSSPPTNRPTDDDDGTVLTCLAVAAVRARLLGVELAVGTPESALLRAPGASFVTLERRGKLRGCIGSLEPSRPLYLDVVRNARRAATDPRLPPVDAGDWLDLDVKVSVLTAPEPIAVDGLAGLLAVLRPGIDGLVFTDGRRRATFLPAVWSKVREPAGFVEALLDKGGWPAGGWPPSLEVCRYTTLEFHAPAPRAPLGLQ